MPIYHYSNAIKVVDFRGKTLGNGSAMPYSDWTTFKERVGKVLELVEKTSTGRQLFAAMQATGKTVTIFSGIDVKGSDDNVAKITPETDAAGMAARIKSFRPAQKNMTLTVKGSEFDYNKAKSNFVQYGEANALKPVRTAVKNQMAALNLPTTIAAAIPEMTAVLNRARLGMAANPRITNNLFRDPQKELAKRLNVPYSDLDDMIVGMAPFPDDLYYPICFLLYDYLTPGPGTDTQLRFATETFFGTNFAPDVASEKTLLRGSSKTAPLIEAAVMGHELIHAWRMMSGRRVVSNGWEEEAMTTGIGPFANWRLTENQFRRDLGLHSRKTYVDNTCSSGVMNVTRFETNNRTYKGIMF